MGGVAPGSRPGSRPGNSRTVQVQWFRWEATDQVQVPDGCRRRAWRHEGRRPYFSPDAPGSRWSLELPAEVTLGGLYWVEIVLDGRFITKLPLRYAFRGGPLRVTACFGKGASTANAWPRARARTERLAARTSSASTLTWSDRLSSSG